VTPEAAPAAAACAALAFVGALATRTPPAAGRIDVTPAPASRRVLTRLGTTRVVRTAAGADRLREAFARAAWPVESADRAAAAATIAASAVVLASIPLGVGSIAVALVASSAALRTPSFVAARAARRRLAVVERDVPLLLDVVALAAFAGLPAQASLARAVEVLEGPLADELSAALVDVSLGARWRDRLGRLARELPVPDLGRAVALLVRTESIGAGFADPIAILADEVRDSRRQHATERARKAPVKMLFPLVFLVLPAFLLLTVVPVLVATLGSIR